MKKTNQSPRTSEKKPGLFSNSPFVSRKKKTPKNSSGGASEDEEMTSPRMKQLRGEQQQGSRRTSGSSLFTGLFGSKEDSPEKMELSSPGQFRHVAGSNSPNSSPMMAKKKKTPVSPRARAPSVEGIHMPATGGASASLSPLAFKHVAGGRAYTESGRWSNTTSPRTSCSHGDADRPSKESLITLIDEIRKVASPQVLAMIEAVVPTFTSIRAIIDNSAQSTQLHRYCGDTAYLPDVGFLLLEAQYRQGEANVRASLMEHIISTHVRDGAPEKVSCDAPIRRGIVAKYENGGRALGLADDPVSSGLFEPLVAPLEKLLDEKLLPEFSRAMKKRAEGSGMRRKYDQLGKLQGDVDKLSHQLDELREQSEAWKVSYLAERTQREKAQRVFKKLLKDYNDDQVTIQNLQSQLKRGGGKKDKMRRHPPKKRPTAPPAQQRIQVSAPKLVHPSDSTPMNLGKLNPVPEKKTRVRKVSDFTIHARLGQGGYGKVFLATEKATNLVCAIKKMSKNLVIDRNQVHTISTEVQVMKEATTDHSPWLVQLHYSFCDQYYLYLAMDLCQGGDLKCLLENVELEEFQVRFFGAEMIASVDALHMRGFVHRDLKPDNFLLHSSGHIKLCDFGLSKAGYEKEKKFQSNSHGLSAQAVRIFYDDRSYKTFIATSTTLVKDLLSMIKAKTSQFGAKEHIQMYQISMSTLNGKQSIKEQQLAMDQLVLDVCAGWEREKQVDDTLKFKLVVRKGEKRLRTSRHSTSGTMRTTRDPFYQPPPMKKREKLYSMVGTPGYMAKEIIEGGGYEAIVDWWSIGCILYEMFVGMPPFTGDTAEELFAAVLNSDETLSFPPEADVSEVAQHLVRSFLTHPKERLGANGVTDIQRHPFFAGVDWENLATQEPPFTPELDDAFDTSYFTTAEDSDKGPLDDKADAGPKLVYDPFTDWDWSIN